MFDRYGLNLLTSKLRLIRRLYKNCVDFGNPSEKTPVVSFGFHENYSTTLSFSRENPKDTLGLIPHLISRTIFAGAGSLHEMKKYLQAQRSLFISHIWGNRTFKDDRGIICTRVEPHTTVQGLQRLHLICGDALISPVNRFLLYGTTATVLDLLEDRKLKIEEYDEALAVEDFEGITRDPRKYILQGYSGKYWTALDVQKYLLDRAGTNYGGRDPQIGALLLLWQDTLKKLEHDPFQLVGRLDSITKQALYLCLDERFPEVSEEMFRQMQGNDMDYHDLNPNKSLFQALRSEGIMEELYSPHLFSRYSQNPPPRTRANFRGKFAEMLQKKTMQMQVLRGDEWDRCSLSPTARNFYPHIEDRVIGDPFNSYHEQLPEAEKLISQ